MDSVSIERCRLYLLTPPVVEDAAAFVDAFKHSADGGDIACLQVRLKNASGKSASDDAVCDLAERLMPACQERDIALLINDRPDLAVRVGADGVHIGQSDASYDEARKLLGPDRVVGVTCHDSRHLALEAGERGADYVAFGAFFPTETKTPLAQAEPELLRWWQQMIEIPCVAIGGVTVDNAETLVRAGADFLAVSSGVWSYSEGPKAAVTALNAIFDQVAGSS